MRSLRGPVALLLGLALASPAEADFSAAGRRRPRREVPKGAGRGSPPARPPASPASATPGSPAAPGTDAKLERYLTLALERPGDPFPLERLTELARRRDGSLDALRARLAERAAEAGDPGYRAGVALAGLDAADGRAAEARAALERAIAAAPGRAEARVALARLLERGGDPAAARVEYEAALPLLRDEAEREGLLRALRGLSLDAGDLSRARVHHDALVARARGSYLVRAELGRELLTRGRLPEAEAELGRLVSESAGDPRALAPALRDLGRVLAARGDAEGALSALRRALDAAAAQPGLRRDILDQLVQVHRARGTLEELASVLGRENTQDPDRLLLLGGIHEEAGRTTEALVCLRRALARRPDRATHERVIRLLELEGRLDEALAELGRLARSAAGDPELGLRLAELRAQRGDEAGALAELARLEATAAGDPDLLFRIADAYVRHGAEPRASALLERVAASAPGEARHVVDLGDQYYRRGDTPRAHRIWERLRGLHPGPGKGDLALGEVLLEHDLVTEALTALGRAAAALPDDARVARAAALAAERAASAAQGAERARLEEAARRGFERVLALSPDPLLAREARQHLVSAWAATGRLAERLRPLERRLAATPPDLEAGRLLAEAASRLRRLDVAERALRRIVEAAPGDLEAWSALERTLVAERRLDAALEVLERLVRADPRRAREHYRRMAEHAAALYRDDDALAYATRAVELSPDDAEGHLRLAELHTRRQDLGRAAAELRRALAKNDRLHAAALALADLRIAAGDTSDASSLLRRVVRGAPDDELIGRAARRLLQLGDDRSGAAALEQELLPLALAARARPIYRRLLVETYDALAAPLLADARAEGARGRAAASAVEALGRRAVKHLVETLADDRSTVRRSALELLAALRPRAAAPSLLGFATGGADPGLRARAMEIVAEIADPALLPRLREVVAPRGGAAPEESDTVALHAGLAAARIGAAAEPLLVELLDAEAPTLRAIAALGLGVARSRGAVARLVDGLGAPTEGAAVRAAYATALGLVGDRRAIPALLGAVRAPQPSLRLAALGALARLDPERAAAPLAAALAGGDRAVQRGAAEIASAGVAAAPGPDALRAEGRPDAARLAASLAPRRGGADDEARALTRLAPARAPALALALREGGEAARSALGALAREGDRIVVAELAAGLHAPAPPLAAAAGAALDELTLSLVPPLVEVAAHPEPALRARAIALLAGRSERSARRALHDALRDPDPAVVVGALAAASGAEPGGSLLAEITRLATSAESWALRAAAASALGAAARGGEGHAALDALVRAAGADPSPFVREGALRALAALPGDRPRAALEAATRDDPEPGVRALARGLLQGAR